MPPRQALERVKNRTGKVNKGELLWQLSKNPVYVICDGQSGVRAYRMGTFARANHRSWCHAC